MIRAVLPVKLGPALLSALSLLAVLACEHGSPAPTPTAPLAPDPVVPTLPPTATATPDTYLRTEPPIIDLGSRLVFAADGSFRLEYQLLSGGGWGSFGGVYSRSGEWYLLAFSDDSRWQAMASFAGSCVDVEFNIWMALSDFENAKYCSGPVSSRQVWLGSWSFDVAEPAGDCLADAMNDWHRNGGGLENWPVSLEVERDGLGVIHLSFGFAANGDTSGFWPARFAGALGADGTIRAAPDVAPGSLRTDPWLDLCYWSWTSEGGELTASISADGRSLTGNVVETFRTVQPEGFVFTVRSEFVATLN